MPLPALVVVHDGAHAGDCWDLTIDEIHRLEPDLDVLAVDLPGRRSKPGDLCTPTTCFRITTSSTAFRVDAAGSWLADCARRSSARASRRSAVYRL